MGYDCSITKRKGCNYCLKRKRIYDDEEFLETYIDDESKMMYNVSYSGMKIEISINYCPVCGKELQ